MKGTSALLAATVVWSLALFLAGCFTAPESCHDCRSNDGGPVDHGNTADHPPGSGGSGVGGATGSGGTIGAGGMTAGAGGMTAGTGGATGAGGKTGSGGATGAGGATGVGGMTSVGGMTGAGGVTAAGGMTGAGGVTAAGGMTGAGGGIVIDPDLVVWYKFDETTGTAASDSSLHNRTGTLTPLGGGTAAFSTTRQVGTASVNLASSSATVGGFVNVPASLPTMGATTAVSLTAWVNVRTNRIWQRVWDFGTSMNVYMFLTTQQAALTPNSVRFAISLNGNGAAEQVIDMNTRAMLPTGTWHHVAVVLAAPAGTGNYTGTLYIDKAVSGTNPAMNLRPSDVGNSVNNWIGRSQFSTADSLFDGQIDDFRVYKRALTAAEITALP